MNEQPQYTRPGNTVPLLDIRNLNITLPIPAGELHAVKNMDLQLAPGEAIGIVGESGSGKSMTALSIMGLLPRVARLSAKTMQLQDFDLLKMGDKALSRRVRGQKVGMIFQEPMTSLNPVYSVGRQLTEAMTLHGASHAHAKKRALELMEAVGLPAPNERFSQYPHQFSGGQRQRLMIAMALMNEPDLLIADEPTTALDVTIQAQILDLLKDLQKRLGIALILISHDLGVVARATDKVLVMLNGEVVESGSTRQILYEPKHDYTKRLLSSMPKAALRAAHEIEAQTLISVEAVSKTYRVRKGIFSPVSEIHAAQDITLEVKRGETLALVGESGSGKTTLSRIMLGLESADRGIVRYDGIEVANISASKRARLVQPVFQDPYSSLNPRRSINAIIKQPLDVHGIGTPFERQSRVEKVMQQTGLSPRFRFAYPNQMSGGQRQRVAIARALILEPEILICDEPTSALDVSIQAQILKLLEDLRHALGLTIVLITHDLGVVEQIADRVVVLKDGMIVESGPCGEILEHPKADYTKNLLQAVPRLDAMRA